MRPRHRFTTLALGSALAWTTTAGSEAAAFDDTRASFFGADLDFLDHAPGRRLGAMLDGEGYGYVAHCENSRG